MKRHRVLARTAAVLVVLGVLFVHAWSYRTFLADDALISLRYSKQLLAGHGLVWNPGERVEGYTNLLWVLSTALVGALGIDLVVAARIVGFLGMAAAALAVMRAAAQRNTDESPAARSLTALAAALLLVVSGPIAGWTFGGLEPPLVAALLAWAVAALLPALAHPAPGRRALWPAGLLLGLLCWARADAGLLAAALVVGFALARRASGRRAFRLSAFLALYPAVFIAAQLAFRRTYYGEWLPNTARARVAFTSERLVNGARYVWDAVPDLAPILLAGIAGLVVALRRRSDSEARSRALVVVVPAVLWCTYIVGIGGDTLHLHRFFVPVLVLLAFATLDALDAIGRRGWKPLVAAAGLFVAAQLVLSLADREKKWATSELWVLRSESIGRLLGRAFGSSEALLAIDPAGGVPFWSELPTIDMLGLCDAHIAKHRPAEFGRGWLGHELGDGRYVFERKPDLVLFCSPFGAKPCFRGGRELFALPEFPRDFTLVQVEGCEPDTQRAGLWVRRESERIGIRKDAGGIVVPGFLLNGNRASIARLDGDRLAVTVDERTSAWIDALAVPAGHWRLEIDASSPGLRAGVRRLGDGALLASGPSGLEFVLEASTAVGIAIVAPPGPPAQAYGLRLVRSP